MSIILKQFLIEYALTDTAIEKRILQINWWIHKEKKEYNFSYKFLVSKNIIFSVHSNKAAICHLQKFISLIS